jgi:hypothetical protein
MLGQSFDEAAPAIKQFANDRRICMPKIEESRAFPNRTADQLYQAFESTYQKAGFQTWKLRPIGWLALAKRQETGSDVQSTFSARPGNPASATLVITSESQSQEQLKAWAAEIWQALDQTV